MCCPWLEGVAPLPFCSVDRHWGGYSESWGTSPWRTEMGTVVSPITISRISSTIMDCMSKCPIDIQADPTTSVRSALDAGIARSNRATREYIQKESVLADMALRLRWGYVSEPEEVSAVDVYGDPRYGGSVFGRHVPRPSQTTLRSGSGLVGLAEDGLVRVGFDKLIVEGLQPQPSEISSGRAQVFLNNPVANISAIGTVRQRPTVEVVSNDGVVRSYDYAICSVSIGVLQSSLVPGGPIQFCDRRSGAPSCNFLTPVLTFTAGQSYLLVRDWLIMFMGSSALRVP